MDYVQERITTLHDLTGRPPAVPVGHAAVVVPMTEREHGSLAVERTFTELARAGPGRVVVALRAGEQRAPEIHQWLGEFDLRLDVLWCTGGTTRALLTEHGLDGDAGKGRDVWLALGVAASSHPYVVCHDADQKTYTGGQVARLVAPLIDGYRFVKGYYARVEEGRLYGRLFRLLYAPLVRALVTDHDAPILDYIGSFRYALAGEFGTTAAVARRLRVERRFGLEVGTLGGAFDEVGFEATAQVDLGRYEHEHRAVGGPTGLAGMSDDVAAALFRVVEEHGVDPDYPALEGAYREAAATLIRQYGSDAAFNGLVYDVAEEHAQVEEYVKAIHAPGDDDRLPAWEEADLDPEAVLAASRTDFS